MNSQRLRHDAAVEASVALLEIVADILMEFEHPCFREEAYHVVLAALESYDIMSAREAARVTPSKN